MYKKREVSEEELKTLRAQLHRDVVICDFCGRDKPKFIYAAKRMSTGDLIECWRWTACENCDDAIVNQDWDRLKERVIEAMAVLRLSGFSLPQITLGVDMALQGFFEDAMFDEEGGQGE